MKKKAAGGWGGGRGSAGEKAPHFCSCQRRARRASFLLKLQAGPKLILRVWGAQGARGARGAGLPGARRARAPRARGSHLGGHSPSGSRVGRVGARTGESRILVKAGRDHGAGPVGVSVGRRQAGGRRSRALRAPVAALVAA